MEGKIKYGRWVKANEEEQEQNRKKEKKKEITIKI